MADDLQQRVAEFKQFADETLRELDRLSEEQRALLKRVLDRIDAAGLEEARNALKNG
ncbi:MAG: hypothetical protein ABIG71_03780 [Candidatus Uhrbacteria bacterium]